MGGTGYLLNGRLTPGLGTARAQNPNQMFITTFVEEHHPRSADAHRHYFPPAVEKGAVVIREKETRGFRGLT
jgi:hypothetical protein